MQSKRYNQLYVLSIHSQYQHPFLVLALRDMKEQKTVDVVLGVSLGPFWLVS